MTYFFRSFKKKKNQAVGEAVDRSRFAQLCNCCITNVGIAAGRNVSHEVDFSSFQPELLRTKESRLPRARS